jgi:transcriptional regulator GlxA family with amidase domain
VVIARRQGGQSQFTPYLSAQNDDESPIARVHARIRGNLGTSLTVGTLARMMGMSTRNLGRMFGQETGVTPHEFIGRARVDAARNLLEGSDKAMKAITYECGFGLSNHMHAVFVKRPGISQGFEMVNYPMPKGLGF